MSYYNHKKHSSQKPKYYYRHEPKGTSPMTPEDELRLLSFSVPQAPPTKPKISDYKLTEKAFNKYESHPEKAERHRKYDIGCMPLFVYWGIVALGYFVCSFFDNLDVGVVLGSCLVLGFLGMFVWAFFTENYNKVQAYDSYKSGIKRYEDELSKYQAKLKRKEDLERQIREKARALKAFIDGSEGDQYLHSLAVQLKGVDVFKYRTEDTWRDMTPREFEFGVGDVFASLGYRVNVTKESSDGGVDIILTKNGQTTYVQCKHYATTTPVAAHEVREFFGVCMQKHFNGIFVHTSNLTSSAQEFVSEPGVKRYLKIVSLSQLISLEKKGCAELLDLNSKSSNSFDFLREVINNKSYFDCRYYWLYNHLFDSSASASQFMRSLKEWEGMRYAVISETPETIQSPLFTIVLGSSEAIRQLSRHKVVIERFPEK